MDLGSGDVVLVARTEDMPEDVRAAVIEVCVAANADEEFRQLFLRYIPSGGRHFLGCRDGEVVSHAVVTTRWFQPEGRAPMCTAFVDAVATSPEQQGLGHATAVMRRLAEEIDDFEIGCLQTDRVSFYERLGWELWEGPLAGREADRLIPTPGQRGVMVLQLAGRERLPLGDGASIERQINRIWGS